MGEILILIIKRQLSICTNTGYAAVKAKLIISLQVKVSGSQPPKQSQRTAKPTAICEVCTASGKGVVKSGILKIRGCSGRKQCKIKDLRGVVR